ncbi:MAG: hypothetical protein ABH885_00300 [Candidatus Omnitrophota bacterium]
MNKNKSLKAISAYVGVRWIASGCLLLLAVGYLLQVFSPLRINTDSYRLLSMAVSAYHGGGYLVDGHPDQYPLAYPFVVKTLLQAHLASSMTLVILNLLCLFVGLWVLYAWSKHQNGLAGSMLPVVFVLSSWVMVKHVTLPITDLLYFGVSSVFLFFIWLFWQQDGHRKWWSFSIALILGYLSLQCRSIGLIIFPALAITTLLHRNIVPFVARILAKRRQTLGIVCVFAVLLFLVVLVIRKTGWYELQFVRFGSYFQWLLASVHRESIGTLFLQNIRYRILEFGEVFSNFPSAKAAKFLPIQYLVGLMAWCVVLYGAWRLLRTKHLLPLSLYFLLYAALMFIWPSYDARFWLPLLPVLALIFLTGADDLVCRWRWPAIRLALQFYLIGFIVLGIVAILFSTRISLSGKEFSDLYGDGTTRMTYRFVFRNGKDVDMGKVSEEQVRLLRIFEPLAKPSPSQE